MGSKSVSLIVPVFNMADYLPELWSSLVQSGATERLKQIIFVNDGSTDQTEQAIQKLKNESDKVVAVSFATNEGRFVARFRGAQAANATHTLFLDARTAIDQTFVNSLFELLDQHDALMGMIKIDVSKSVYNLYWQRTHERIFRKHFRDSQKGFLLTAENYESYAKGTTVFLCPRQAFLDACEKYKDQPLHSDDTFLMRDIVENYPIWVDNRLAIDWEPRQGYWAFLVRLWERGPQFAEYHVFERQGLYFVLFMAWTVTVFATLAMLVLQPVLGLTVLLSGLVLLALSTAIFANSPLEFFRMIPVHVGTILAYGLGAIYGVGVNLNLFRKPPPTAARR